MANNKAENTNNILSIDRYKENKIKNAGNAKRKDNGDYTETVRIPLPTKQEADAVKNIVKMCSNQNPDVPIDSRFWDGECWKSIFETLKDSCPEIDPWDALAVFIMKMNGVKFDEDENGNVISITAP